MVGRLKSDSKRPRIKAKDDDLLLFFKLSKAGYGTVDELEKWNARKVLQALAYENFCDEYETTFMELNK